MATQEGIITYSGKLGDTVGYARKGKHFKRVQAKTYQLTEETLKSATEFGNGSTAAALTRLAFASLLLHPFKSNLHNRLAEAYRKVIRSGAQAKKGQRNVFDGNVRLLDGFEFNDKKRFSNLLNLQHEVNFLNPVLRLEIAAIHWADVLAKPNNADRVVLRFGFGFLDFKSRAYQLKLAPALKIDRVKCFDGGSLHMDIPVADEQLVMIMANLQFESGKKEASKDTYFINQQLYQAGVVLAALHFRKGEIVWFEEEILPQAPIGPSLMPDLVWELK